MEIMNDRISSTVGGGGLTTGLALGYSGSWNINSSATNSINIFPYNLGTNIAFDTGGAIQGLSQSRNRLAYQGGASDISGMVSVAAFSEADMNGNTGRITYLGDAGNFGGSQQTDKNMLLAKNLQNFLLPPSKCSAPLEAVNDTGAANSLTGGVSIDNVLLNDNMNPGGINGVIYPIIGSVVTIKEVPNSSTAPVNFPMTLDVNTGSVSITPGTPVGSYSLNYEYCQISNPTNCAIATATVNVTIPATVTAVNDYGSAQSLPGGQAIANVLSNDLIDWGAGAVTPTIDKVFMMEIPGTNTSPVNFYISLDTSSGAVLVPPGTPAGDYEFQYRFCEIAYSNNCATATAFIKVTAPMQLNATDNSGTIGSSTGGTAIPNVLSNDTMSDGVGAPITPTVDKVVLSEVPGSNTSPNGFTITLDVSTGAVNVPPNTPAGIYELKYQYCGRIQK